MPETKAKKFRDKLAAAFGKMKRKRMEKKQQSAKERQQGEDKKCSCGK